MTDKHLSTQFDAELSGISTRVLEMGGLVESQVAQAVYALSTFSGEVATQVLRAKSASTRWRSRSTATCRPSSRGASPRRATCAC
jgi:phosphate uptake regulator